MSVSSPIETKGPISESFILTFLPMKTGWVIFTLPDFMKLLFSSRIILEFIIFFADSINNLGVPQSIQVSIS